MAPSCAAAGLLLLLLLAVVLSNEAKDQRPKTLRRRKREWILPPAKLMENVDYTQKPYITKIRSDQDKQTKVEYYLTGPGANKPPVNLFVVDHVTGFVHITGIVDREKYPFFNLTGVAKYADGTLAEYNIPLTVTILDMNDNAPHFELHSGSVSEGSAAGTFVMQIEGTDDDEPGTMNSKISYSIVSQEPKGFAHMFTIDKETGKLYVKEPTLDRETTDFYRLVVQGVDLGGAAGGLKGSGTVEIRVLDINDNIPTLEQSAYSSSVDENVHDVVVSRIKALDLDIEHTDNWRAVFEIAKGNEDNIFTIETDENTNEGILKLVKPLDFEEVQNLELAVLIRNVAPFVKGNAAIVDVGVKVGEGEPLAPTVGAGGGAGVHLEEGVGVEGPGGDLGAGLHLEATLNGGADAGGGTKAYPIRIAVNNVPEDPAFTPPVKEIPVSEDPKEQPEDGIIAVFTAVDPDTGKPAQRIRYAKASDPDNWFTIDEETAEIKLNKKPDRESPFVVNGAYVAEIVAISKGEPSTTATGTISIQVADSNDHCPTLSSTRISLCADSRSVSLTARDEDASANAAPFTFTVVPEGSQGSWDVEVINDTTAAFHSRENLWPGVYKLQVMLSDAQGQSCPADEVLTLHVCTCVDTRICGLGADRRAASSSQLSAAAISLLLLATGLLLLAPLLLLFCQCGGANTVFPDRFTDLPFEAKEHLISYHTEGKGKDEEVPLKSVPVMLPAVMDTSPNLQEVDSKITETYEMAMFYKESMESNFQETREMLNRFRGSGSVLRPGDTRTAVFEQLALSDAFLQGYYTQRAAWAMPEKDGLLEFIFEARGSSAGSLSSCSLLDSQDDLHFLNDLGMKFRKLAEVCSPPEHPSPATPSAPAATLMAAAASTSEHVHQRLGPQRETAQTLISSSITSRTSVSGVGASKRAGAEAVTTGHWSNLSQAAALLPQPQTVLLQQQQPLYYAASTILQPVQYVVQPQLQKMVLLADGGPRASYPGLFMVQGSKDPLPPPPLQGSASALVIQGGEPSRTLQSQASPSSPALVLPVSPARAPTSVSLQGWKIVVPNPDGKPSFVGTNSSPGAAERDPGSSQGTLHRGAILVKEAAAHPQGC